MAGVFAAGALVFVWVVGGHYPVEQWLFFHYLRAASLAVVFSITCLIAGHAVLVRALRRTLPIEEHFAVAFSLGVLAFFLVSLAFGLAGLYGAPFFFLGPSVLLALGASDAVRAAARLRRHTARLDLRIKLGPLDAAALGLGLLGLLLVWFPTLTPQNASYDARWYHLPLAEHYVAQGGIGRFDEGWVVGAQPHLASLLYAWAFSLPGPLFDRIEAAAQMEVAVVLATLVGVAALARRALGRRAPLSWAALFLFPGVFCYDSGLVLGADHIAALWAPAIFLLAMRYREAPEPAYALLLGAAVAGALDTKATAVILAPLPLAVVALRAAADLRRERSLRPLGPALRVLAAAAALTAPCWLKNWVYHGDPLFPLLRAWLPARPWTEAAEAPYAVWFQLRRPAFSARSVAEMARTLLTFSLVPHDFEQYHGKVPVFGSLFTFCTPALLLLGKRPRLAWLFAGAYLGVAAWFWVHQLDRYLQALLPWMAAATAAALALAWRQGALVRAAVCLLVGLQIVWGADVFTIPSHRAGGGVIAFSALDLLGRGYRKEYGERFTPYRDWQAIAQALPRGARVLVHEEEIHLGLGAPSVLDYPGNQGSLYWGEPGASSPAEVWRLLRAHGVTHLVWASRLDHGTDTVAGGLVFFDFASRHAEPVGTYGGFALAALPPSPPPDQAPGLVAYYPCDPDPLFAPGLYPLGAMARSPGDRRPVEPPLAGVSMDEALERAQFLVFDARCHEPLPEQARARFELLAARGRAMLLERRPADGAAP